jgi:acetylglutamate kinase
MKPEHVALLRQALPFITRFKGKIFVIKIGGEVAHTPEQLNAFCEEVALLVQVGIKVVLIHGGGPQATELADQLGIKTQKVDGRRITDDATLDVAKMVFAGKINVDILSSLRRAGVRPVGISGVDGDVVTARRRPPVEVEGKLVDFGHVGDITAVDPGLILTLLSGDFVPVIASLGADDDGHIYNINADTVAAKIAVAMGAEKMILASNVDGVLVGGQVASRIGLEELGALTKNGTISGGMLPKVQAAAEAMRHGVVSAHILNGMKADTLLLEVFTQDGCGTMIGRQA